MTRGLFNHCLLLICVLQYPQHSEARTAAYLSICASACQRAVQVLIDGGTALEAATEATIVLEDAGETNAGYGSNLVCVLCMRII